MANSTIHIHNCSLYLDHPLSSLSLKLQLLSPPFLPLSVISCSHTHIISHLHCHFNSLGHHLPLSPWFSMSSYQYDIHLYLHWCTYCWHVHNASQLHSWLAFHCRFLDEMLFDSVVVCGFVRMCVALILTRGLGKYQTLIKQVEKTAYQITVSLQTCWNHLLLLLSLPPLLLLLLLLMYLQCFCHFASADAFNCCCCHFWMLLLLLLWSLLMIFSVVVVTVTVTVTVAFAVAPVLFLLLLLLLLLLLPSILLLLCCCCNSCCYYCFYCQC